MIKAFLIKKTGKKYPDPINAYWLSLCRKQKQLKQNTVDW